MQPTLTVHLSAIKENYRRLKQQFSGNAVAAVVKADAYGLGAAEVSQALLKEKCPMLFVATLEEAITLKAQLLENLAGRNEARQAGRVSPEREQLASRPMEFSEKNSGDKQKLPPPYPPRKRGGEIPPIAVFHGPYKGQEEDFIAHGLIPVINYVSQLERWMLKSEPTDQAAYILHVDTGMTRLGLSQSELKWVREHGTSLSERKPMFLMSHLACANNKEHEKNAQQLERFEEAKGLLEDVPTSLCNSSGIFLDRLFHGAMARPGCALYGINPAKWLDENPMQHVADLSAPIVMMRHLDRWETIGYGATAMSEKDSIIAVVQLGYADGYLRHLSNKGSMFIEGIACPIMGRVSMDMVALDVTHLTEHMRSSAEKVDIICKEQPVDVVAKAAETIGYEIFTRLGARVVREYTE